MVNQLREKGGSFTPKGLPALNAGGKTKSEQGINRGKTSRATGGEMYKKPGKTGRGLVGARSDESSSETGPTKQSKGPGCDNERTYRGMKQPIAYSNADGMKPTKFIN